MKKLKQLIGEAIPILFFVAIWFAITAFFGLTEKWVGHVDPEFLALVMIVALAFFSGRGDRQK